MIYTGKNYNQVCDSVGPHNKATLTDQQDGTTHFQWLPTRRENTLDYEHIYGGDFSWDDIYLWCSMPFTPPPSEHVQLVQLIDVMPLTLEDVNAFEFEVHAVPFVSEIYNMAWQFTQVKPCRAATFNFGHGSWEKAFDVPTPILSVGKWSTFCAQYEISPKGPLHTGLQYDGVLRDVTIQRPWVQSYKDGDKKPHINFAWQFDSLNKGVMIEAIVRARLVVL